MTSVSLHTFVFPHLYRALDLDFPIPRAKLPLNQPLLEYRHPSIIRKSSPAGQRGGEREVDSRHQDAGEIMPQTEASNDGESNKSIRAAAFLLPSCLRGRVSGPGHGRYWELP